MFNRQLRANIKQLDLQIGLLGVELIGLEDGTEYELKLQNIEELTKIRCQLAESKVKASHTDAILSGIFGIAGVLLVLNYEKTDIITTKGFGMATKMFKGG